MKQVRNQTCQEQAPPTQEQLASPLWRIRNFYTIRNRKGKPLKFTPTPEQDKVLNEIYVLKRKKIFIPKARQLGMSTLVAIIILDSILFGTGVQISISDFVAGNAKKKLEEKIVYAFDKMPAEWKEGWQIVTHNKQSGEFRIRAKHLEGVDKESAVYAGDSIRGGTNQLIHLSELGETQIKAPERARETIEGGMPSAEDSIIIIETTWHGGKHGQLYRILDDALTTPDAEKDPDKDFFVMFFSWDTEPSYIHKGDQASITKETHSYFDGLTARNGKTYTNPQRLWYQKQKAKYGERVYSIYPSEIAEIFLSPVEGAVFAKEIDIARGSGRINKFPHDSSRPVHTLWDIGAPENTIVWYFQIIGDKFRFIDCDVESGKNKDGKDNGEINGLDITFPQRVKMMNEKPYRYGFHYLPHDGRSKNDLRNRTTAQEDLRRHGLQGTTIIVPRITQKYLAVDKTKQMFWQFEFDTERCGNAVDALAMYRRKQDPWDDKKFLNEFVHDWTSHLADSIMQLATAFIYNHIAEEGNESMTNMMLDSEVIKKMSEKASTEMPINGVIAKQGARVSFTREEGKNTSWMSKWDSPRYGHSYMIVIHNGIFQVWQAPFEQTDESNLTEMSKPMRLVASSIPDSRVDEDILVEWAAMASRIYGGCIIVPTIGDRDKIIDKLWQHDCMIYRRDVRSSMRPVGRDRPAKKPGFEFSPAIKADAMEELVSFVRDNKIEFWDMKLISQTHTYTTSPDGVYDVEPGHDGRRVEAAAIAVLCRSSATLFEGMK
jgi:hypothetical protein